MVPNPETFPVLRQRRGSHRAPAITKRRRCWLIPACGLSKTTAVGFRPDSAKGAKTAVGFRPDSAEGAKYDSQGQVRSEAEHVAPGTVPQSAVEA
jgi:hypothetical protein